MKEGLDIRGIYYWTLLDNFEWNAGYSIKFGLFAWDPTGKDGDRAPRGTSRLLVRGKGGFPVSSFFCFDYELKSFNLRIDNASNNELLDLMFRPIMPFSGPMSETTCTVFLLPVFHRLRPMAYGTYCYGISQNVSLLTRGSPPICCSLSQAKWYSWLPSDIPTLKAKLQQQKPQQGGPVGSSSSPPEGEVTAVAAEVQPCPPWPTWTWWGVDWMLRGAGLLQGGMQALGLASEPGDKVVESLECH